MNKTEIALKKLNGIVVPSITTEGEGSLFVHQLNSNIMNFGFMLSQELITSLSAIDEDDLHDLYNELIPALQELTGADDYRPMYTGFPKQVVEMPDWRLYLTAMAHYQSQGSWLPAHSEIIRERAGEHTTFKILRPVTNDQVNGILTKILSSADSITGYDTQIIEYFHRTLNSFNDYVPDQIPFKENMCVVAALRLVDGEDISPLVKTGTDVMRIATYLSDGDISLAKKTRFKSQPKRIRRLLTEQLARCLDDEDLARRPNEWVRLAHNLHVGDFDRSVWRRLQRVRDNSRRKTLDTFNGKLEKAIKTDVIGSLELLQNRPGEFARRIGEVLDNHGDNYEDIKKTFAGVVDRIPTRICLQVLGYLNSRSQDQEFMYVMPKGQIQSAVLVNKARKALPTNQLAELSELLIASLIKRFSAKEDLGKVYIDPLMDNCPLPTQLRSASDSLQTVARGTRLPIGDNNTLRFFVYWVGQDIDLSASLHDESFDVANHLSYTNLRDSFGHHSGDITSAPNGASEFIDIDIKKVLEAGHRYVSMNVYVFSGPTFAEHEVCYAGWMTRDHPDSNEIYEPTTVQQKLMLAAESRTMVPVVFDLKTREAIWLDLTGASRSWGGSSDFSGFQNVQWNAGNNVEAHKASLGQTAEFFMTRNNQVSIKQLMEWHAEARGELVDDPSEADFVVSFDGDLTPMHVTEINSEYIID